MHLLLTVGRSKGGDDQRATSIRLNVSVSGWSRRQRVLPASATADEVELFQDEALETLAHMRYSCALDVVDEYPDGVPVTGVALALGMQPTAVQALLARAAPRLRAGLADLAHDDTEDP